MIYFLIGTKAQFIKMAPVVLETQRRGLRWTLIDMGQHAGITARIRADFGIGDCAVPLLKDQETVSDYGGAARWLLRLGKRLLHGKDTRHRFFEETGIVLVHGDTLSTLMGTLLARRLNLPVGLVEAGLTSGKLFSPFPEELTRRICERLASLLFAPGDSATLRLSRCKGTVVNTGGNTGEDALRHVLRKPPTDMGYLLLTLHRLETLRSRRRLVHLVEYLRDCTRRFSNVKFVLHHPTRRALERYGLLDKLSEVESIELIDLLPYPEFLELMANATMVATDGGSVQEECSYLQKPCIILRNQTERPHGIGETASLTTWKATDDIELLAAMKEQTSHASKPRVTASAIIVDAIEDFS